MDVHAGEDDPLPGQREVGIPEDVSEQRCRFDDAFVCPTVAAYDCSHHV